MKSIANKTKTAKYGDAEIQLRCNLIFKGLKSLDLASLIGGCRESRPLTLKLVKFSDNFHGKLLRGDLVRRVMPPLRQSHLASRIHTTMVRRPSDPSVFVTVHISAKD